MNPTTIYLIGQISTHPETVLWRQRIAKRFKAWPNFNFIDPCNQHFTKTALELSKKDSDQFTSIVEASKIHDVIAPRDCNYV